MASVSKPLAVNAIALQSSNSTVPRRRLAATLPVKRRSQVICFASQDKAAETPEAKNTVWRTLVAAASAAVVLASPFQDAALAGEFKTYYGTAASASSYGGYGGNASKQDSAEYVYDVPAEWKERAVSKVEKGTNGTDSEWFNPKKRTEKTYLTFLAGFRRLPPKDDVLNNIALSDVDLQDLLASADSIDFNERTEGNQVYYDFEIESSQGHALISVTAAKNKLYSHFVNADPNTWSKDEATLRQIHDSFRTVGRDPLGSS